MLMSEYLSGNGIDGDVDVGCVLLQSPVVTNITLLSKRFLSLTLSPVAVVFIYMDLFSTRSLFAMP